MKTKLGVLILLLAAAVAPAQTNNLTALLQQGLFEEQASRNLDAAIADYQALARQFDQDRQLAATAVFRLGECYRTQGKTNEAALEYQRILRDFSDQATLATLSRQNLTGMGMTAAPAASAALQTQRELLAKQIDLAGQDLADAQRRAQTGVVPQADVRTAEREVLRLKQQLAALDSGRPALTDLSVPASSEEDQEIQRIQTMIQNSPDLINVLNNGNTPLGNAAAHGWLKVATFLLDHGADVNSGFDSAIFSATQAGNRAMVELLLSRGANVNANQQDTEGNTPLHLAAQDGYQAVVEVLLANKADVNAQTRSGNTPLLLAAQRNNPKILSLLLDHKADVNAQNNAGDSPLSIAARAGQLENVKLLLAAGANPNAEDIFGRTPLSYAADNGSPETVKLLLDAKADPNGGKLDAPLIGAIRKRETNSVELLLEAGANPNAIGTVGNASSDYSRPFDSSGRRSSLTPLFLAISTKQLPMVQLLLKFKADPNGSQPDGDPLIFAALPHLDILATLLDAGADPNRPSLNVPGGPSPQGASPLMSAVGNSFYETLAGNLAAAKLLLGHGANPTATNQNGDTALRWVIVLVYSERWANDPTRLELVKLLLEHGANPNVRYKDGQTPLDKLKISLASNDASPDQKALAGQLADLLRQHGALDVLPDWDRITVSRPAANFSRAVFQKGTNDWNQVSLYDVLGVQYGLITDVPIARYAASPYSTSDFAIHNSLSFPDFSNIIIHQPSADGKQWEMRKVNLTAALNTGDCSGDVMLHWGDVVEIPEADHVINQQWTGLTTNELMTLKSCLTRHLQITVNGKTTSFTVSPQVTLTPNVVMNSAEGPITLVRLVTGEPFMLWPVLDESKTLLASADLSRVKIKRHNSATGKTEEWLVDCSNQQSPPDFWLRDGDVIEVPARP